MKLFLAIVGAVTAVATLIIKFWNRNPGIDPKLKEALRLRKDASEQTNRELLKLQKRELESLREDVNSLTDKLESLIWLRKTNPPGGKPNP